VTSVAERRQAKTKALEKIITKKPVAPLVLKRTAKRRQMVEMMEIR
jgi:hypothetical protein